MLSLTCKHAIRAVVFLAFRHESGERCGLLEIAETIQASEHSVGKLLQTLVKAGLVNSSKGPGGGFYLTAAQLQRPVLTIVEAIDGPEIFRQCGLGFSRCSDAHPCPLHGEYKKVRDLFGKMCREKTISDLCDPVNKGLAHLLG